VRRDLARLEAGVHDLLVVGGGIYGACVARDAAQRGLKVALVERGDFGGATSHNSLKLIHGGLRYLQHGDLVRIRQSAREQRIWLTIAPHLVRPLEFVLPAYGHGVRGPEVLAAAVRLYEWLTRAERRVLPPARRLLPGRRLSAAACRERIPGVPDAGLTGGVAWHDAQMLHADRLLLACIEDAAAAGAAVANYVAGEALLGKEDRVEGVRARCTLSGDVVALRARVTVNACGPFAPGLLQGTRAATDLRGALTRNMNVVTTRPLFPDYAVGVSSRRRADAVIPRGGRMYFITPWQGRTVIGTSHLPFRGDPDAFAFSEDDIEAFLEEINDAYPPARLERGDVLYCYAGLTPAEAEPAGSEIRRSRRGQLIDHAAGGGPQGLVSLQGVKYTTARLVAEAAVDLVCNKLERKAPPCRSADTVLPDGKGFSSLEALEQEAALAPDDPAEWRRLLQAYGTGYRRVLEAADSKGGARFWSGDDLFRCRVRHALRHEMAQRLEDLVLRRLEHAALGQLSEARLVWSAAAMAAAFGWSEARRQSELAAVRLALGRHQPVSSAAPDRREPSPALQLQSMSSSSWK
jgi:glycerol-3-phosphate dehydrogenase